MSAAPATAAHSDASDASDALAEIEAAIGAMGDSLMVLGPGFRSVVAQNAFLHRAVSAHRQRQQAEHQLLLERSRRERQALEESRKARQLL